MGPRPTISQSALDDYLDLDRDLDLDLARVRTYFFTLYWYLMALVLDQDERASWRMRRGSKYQQWRAAMVALADDYLQSFVDFCVLEERIKGNLSPFEGILLVKEIMDLE